MFVAGRVSFQDQFTHQSENCAPSSVETQARLHARSHGDHATHLMPERRICLLAPGIPAR